ncbi:MAG: DUF3604 domain-containing protein, partial [Bryobacteraceae bacterium]
ETLVKKVKSSNLTNRMGYYVYVVRVLVREGKLRAGDTISVIYRMRASIVASHPEPVLVAVDTDGSGSFRLLGGPPMVYTRSARAIAIEANAPSEMAMGASAALHIALLDAYDNPASGGAVELALTAIEGGARFPVRVPLPAGKAWADVPFTASATGPLRFEVKEAGRRLSARSNPIEVLAKAPAFALYWGDLHSHTAFSVADAVGSAEDAHEYARHVSGLQFYAMTDHTHPAAEIARGLSHKEYDAYNRLADVFDDPGAFVSMHAYEASFGSPYGHHNVYFRNQPGPVLDPDTRTLPQLWQALKAGEALTIPHHTMKMPDVVNWTGVHDPRFRRNFEIYSGHGLSESHDPSHPLAFEQSLFTNASTTSKTGTSAQSAWEQGLELSTIAASDDHRAHPGQPHAGLAAVRAHALTRDGIFDALAARRTYGTTGARIILDFRVNGVEMGGHLKASDVQARDVRIDVRAIGTGIIETVEVLRHSEGEPGFQVVHAASPARASAISCGSASPWHG